MLPGSCCHSRVRRKVSITHFNSRIFCILGDCIWAVLGSSQIIWRKKKSCFLSCFFNIQCLLVALTTMFPLIRVAFTISNKYHCLLRIAPKTCLENLQFYLNWPSRKTTSTNLWLSNPRNFLYAPKDSQTRWLWQTHQIHLWSLQWRTIIIHRN